MDMVDFSHQLYVEYVPLTKSEKERVLDMDVGNDGRWDMTESVAWKVVSKREVKVEMKEMEKEEVKEVKELKKLKEMVKTEQFQYPLDSEDE